MASLTDLYERRRTIVAEMDALEKVCDDESRDLTKTECARMDVLIEEATKVSAQIAGKREVTRAKEIAELERRSATGPTHCSLSTPLRDSQRGGPNAGEHIDFYRNASVDVGARECRSYHAMFPDCALSNDGFDTPHAYFAAVCSDRHHPNLREARGMGEAVGSTGGFLVPSEFIAGWLDASLEDEIVRPRCRPEPMVSNEKLIADFANMTRAGTHALYGGWTGQWLAEGATATEADAKVRAIKLVAKKLAIFTSASNELVSDGNNFEQTLGQRLTKAIGWHLDYACLRGSGAGQPQGIINASSRVTQTKETLQGANTVTYLNLANMFSRLHPACVNNSVWIAHTSCIPQLATLTVVGGVGTTWVPAMTRGTNGWEVLSRPVVFTEKLPTLGTEGDIVLADLSQYALGLRSEVTLEKSRDAGWSTDSSKYRIILRADGMPTWAAVDTGASGSTSSWCVTLETRT